MAKQPPPLFRPVNYDVDELARIMRKMLADVPHARRLASGPLLAVVTADESPDVAVIVVGHPRPLNADHSVAAMLAQMGVKLIAEAMARAAGDDPSTLKMRTDTYQPEEPENRDN